MTSADYTLHGAVAVIRLDNAPVNALSASVRKGIAEGLDRAADTDSVTAVILTGAGSNFCGGADVTEFNTPQMVAAPNLHDLCDLIESFEKPVIAALNGIALGSLSSRSPCSAPGASACLPAAIGRRMSRAKPTSPGA